MRTDGRKNNDLRRVSIIPEVLRFAEGSAEVNFGSTKVLCAVSLDEMVPKWLSGSGRGWISAEYGMLPRSTHQRIKRDKALSGGRTQEISRLIGRSLRAAVDLRKMPDKHIIVDCDVIQADGGTRTAAVTGGFVALALALKFLKEQGQLSELPLLHYVSAISVGLREGEALLDLNYDEDSTMHTDMNFVMTDRNQFVEIQGTAEGEPFDQSHLSEMIELARGGCCELFKIQSDLVGAFFPLPG